MSDPRPEDGIRPNMETDMDMEIQQIIITAPYSPKKGEMSCRIVLKNEYTNIDMKLDSELLKPIVDVVAAAIADAGQKTAETLRQAALDHVNRDQPVIEHASQPEQVEEIVEDKVEEAPLPAEDPGPCSAAESEVGY